LHDSLPDEAFNLLERLLALDPAQRITAEEALDHDYFWKGVRPAPPEYVS